jgi:hypothetical protein
LLLTRRIAAAAPASLLAASALLIVLFSVRDSQAQSSPATCEEAAELAVLASPIAPWKGAPLRVIFAAEKPLEGEFSLIAPDGKVAAKSGERHGGPPYFWVAEVAKPVAGTWHVKLARDGAAGECATITRDIAVLDREPPRPHATDGSLWPVRNTWNRATENLYSAWIEKLFDAPLDEAPSWKALHVKCCVTRRATSCSITWVCAKTRWGLSFVPTAPIFHTFCAPISRSRWGCRSDIRSVRAGVPARRRNVTRGGTFRILSRRR